MKTVEALLKALEVDSTSIEFADVMQVINDSYTFTPVRFTCGEAVNESGSNEGSCKILAFGRIHDLSQAQTLALFGRFYREDVLGHPDGTDHANIRNFMLCGWSGVSFESEPLAIRTSL